MLSFRNTSLNPIIVQVPPLNLSTTEDLGPGQTSLSNGSEQVDVENVDLSRPPSSPDLLATDPVILHMCRIMNTKVTFSIEPDQVQANNHRAYNFIHSTSCSEKLPIPSVFPPKLNSNIAWPSFCRHSHPLENGIIINASNLSSVPKSVPEAMQSEFAPEYLHAMCEEVSSLMKHNTYNIVERPYNRKVIKSKWVFDHKVNSSNQVVRFKARFVACGYSQIKDIDYKETFSPVVKMPTIRFFLALTMRMDLIINIIDINTAFLYGILREEIYCNLPYGFEVFDKNGHVMVCQLMRALYGLKQASSEWHRCIKDYLLDLHFICLVSDPCVFLFREQSRLILVLIYVDDIIILSNTAILAENFKSDIRKKFSIKEIPNSDWILKMQIKRSKNGLWLGQPNKIQDLLVECDIWDIPISQYANTPMECNWKLDTSSTGLSDDMKSQYRSILMTLSYFSLVCRPDIMFAVNTLAQYQQAPTVFLWHSLIRILRYLRNTYDLGLYYQKSNDEIVIFDSAENPSSLLPDAKPVGYADASFAEDPGRASRTGVVFYCFGCAINWMSKKQSLVALSSTEAEYIALSECIRDGLAFRNMLNELQFDSESILVHQDNKSTICIATNPVQQARTKHIDVKLRFIESHIQKDQVKLVHCPTKYMIADLLTKSLPCKDFLRLRTMLGMSSMYSDKIDRVSLNFMSF